MNNLQLTKSADLGATRVAGLLLSTFSAEAGKLILPEELVEAAQHEEPRGIDVTGPHHAPGGVTLPVRDKPKFLLPADMVKDAQDKPMLDPSLIDFTPGGAKLDVPAGDQGVLRLACSFGPEGLKIRNVGEVDAPAGLKLKWQARGLPLDGVVRLDKSLRSGHAASLGGVAATGAECGLKVVS